MKVFGTVKDVKKEMPIPNAKISLYIGEKELAVLYSDSIGEFEHKEAASYIGETLICQVEKTGCHPQKAIYKIEQHEVLLDIELVPIIRENSLIRFFRSLIKFLQRRWPIVAGGVATVVILVVVLIIFFNIIGKPPQPVSFKPIEDSKPAQPANVKPIEDSKPAQPANVKPIEDSKPAQPVSFKPIEDLGIGNLSDDKEWEKDLKRLQDALFSTGALPESANEEFMGQSYRLKNFESCMKLVMEEQRIREEIQRLEKSLPEDPDNSTLIARWGDDQVDLGNQIGKYIKYSQSDYWARGSDTPAAVSYHQKFHDWLAKNPSGLRQLKFFSNLDRSLYGTRANPQDPDISISFSYAIWLDYTEPSIHYSHKFCHWDLSREDSSDKEYANFDLESKDKDLVDFFNKAIAVCKYYKKELEAQDKAYKEEKKKIDKLINDCKTDLNNLRENGLAIERKNFLDFWNNPETNSTTPTRTK